MTGRVLPTQERWLALQQKLQFVKSRESCTVKQFHVSDRITYSHREQVWSGRLHVRPIQWHLNQHWHVPEILEKVIPIPTSRLVVRQEKCTPGSAVSSPKTRSASVYRCLKRGWGTHFVDSTARGVWSDTESCFHIRIEAPQRLSTRAVYKSKWAVYIKWCKSNKVDFRSPSLNQIADFLLHLFKERKLQPSTIEGYRTAIADMVGNDRLNISKDENLTRCLDSFHRDKPKGRRGVPTWNLSLELHQLRLLLKPCKRHLLSTCLLRQSFFWPWLRQEN